MTEAEWLACGNVYELLKHLGASASARKTRLLGCACVRRAWEWGLNEPVPEAVHVTEAFADGLATKEDLSRVVAEIGLLWRNDDEPFRPYPRTCFLTEVLAAPDNDRAWVEDLDAFAIDLEVFDDPEWLKSVEYVHEIFGNPFRPITFSPSWRTDTALSLARTMYDSRDFSAMPILADALQDAGCESDAILNHCRGPGPHVRGCWVVDRVLGKK
jgi:hypothetical protein